MVLVVRGAGRPLEENCECSQKSRRRGEGSGDDSQGRQKKCLAALSGVEGRAKATSIVYRARRSLVLAASASQWRQVDGRGLHLAKRHGGASLPRLHACRGMSRYLQLNLTSRRGDALEETRRASQAGLGSGRRCSHTHGQAGQGGQWAWLGPWFCLQSWRVASIGGRGGGRGSSVVAAGATVATVVWQEAATAAAAAAAAKLLAIASFSRAEQTGRPWQTLLRKKTATDDAAMLKGVGCCSRRGNLPSRAHSRIPFLHHHSRTRSP